MRKERLTRERFFNILILFELVCALILFPACGLDSYYVLDPPVSDGHTATYSDEDYTQRYFSFMTYETGTNADYLSSTSEFTFLGTEVYYKIFNNVSTMASCQSAVSALNTASYYSSAAEKLIDTQGYKPLRLSTGSISPLVKATGKNRYVYIRLTDYLTSSAYQQGICVGSSSMDSYSSDDALEYDDEPVYPRRYIDSSYTFNFGGDDTDTDVVPDKDDDDVYWSDTTTEDGSWYVDMYAVSIGRDTTYTNSYSLVLHLGSVTIVEGEDTN